MVDSPIAKSNDLQVTLESVNANCPGSGLSTSVGDFESFATDNTVKFKNIAMVVTIMDNTLSKD